MPTSPDHTASEAASRRVRTRLVAVIAAILVVAALGSSKPVTLPLVLGVFLVVLSWPLQRALEPRIPRPLAITVTALAVLLAIAIIAGAFAWSTIRVAERAPEIERQLGYLQGRMAHWASARGIQLEEAGLGAPDAALAARYVRGALDAIYTALVTIGLALAFLVLGLIEARDFEKKIVTRLPKELADEVLATVATIGRKVRRYLLALSITSAISGVATGLFAFAMGLELAPLWGIATFVLNFMPTVGPAVAVFPPTLYAFLQFEGAARALGVFAGIGAIQFFVGNFIDPKIEGRVLSLSPTVVLFAILFWGWVWGAFGALLAVPITAALAIVAEHTPGTRGIAALIADARGGGGAGQVSGGRFD